MKQINPEHWDEYEADGNWCPDCGEPRFACLCGAYSHECGLFEANGVYSCRDLGLESCYWCRRHHLVGQDAEGAAWEG